MSNENQFRKAKCKFRQELPFGVCTYPHTVLPTKKNKLIIFRWEYILAMDAVFKHGYYLIFKHISLDMNDFWLVQTISLLPGSYDFNTSI